MIRTPVQRQQDKTNQNRGKRHSFIQRLFKP